MQEKKDKLESISAWYNSPECPLKSPDSVWSNLAFYRYKTFRQFFTGESILELGFANGVITKYICEEGFFKRMVGVDGAKKFVNEIKKKFSFYGYEAVYSLFEDYETDEKFDFILASHILEHLKNRVEFLSKYANLLKNKKSRFLIMVPNANSIHRQIGVKLGLLKHTEELNSLDVTVDHQTVYTKKTLIKDARKAGLKVIKSGGIFLKPLSSKQIEDCFNKPLLNAFFELGADYPEISAEIFVVCAKL
ncbi:hypothetical protein COX24_02260 [bacterium (Candidatus Gribaldobacteria) CG23_combo_of_CG06-09_8_20_14_all_37_87_8]|uniref:Uncharacterized protein n=1 Tax=bacterium (Candidatus Gribaldobacteria) CG23_combo_of_CG06-09_8_20_14_all_37_87_8 TaxID=2014278 RepID=A0A2G9ZEU0_9BACT|nr:MAG: hypothetical protein COX24_02260 [bacterium (Candidatus Gribaldobacteria) CG23_combo_of_CG06-09_8_20_14_all_37_87_8]